MNWHSDSVGDPLQESQRHGNPPGSPFTIQATSLMAVTD
jgi:hypothetical protein